MLSFVVSRNLFIVYEENIVYRNWFFNRSKNKLRLGCAGNFFTKVHQKLASQGPFFGPWRSRRVPWALIELNNDQISVGQPHPALGLKPPNNDRPQGHLVKALWIFSHPNLCHQYNTIGKPETEPCRYTSYIHQYVKKTSMLAYIDMSRHISLFSAPEERLQNNPWQRLW